ncbi:hypothetical protein FRB90_004690, partial [Tulasnella sp. 427]
MELEGLIEDTPKRMIWLAFPWAEHGNLLTFIASRDWEIPERLFLIHDVAQGVAFLHSQTPPIYHGDLKSPNVLVNEKYRAVITDFGSARRIRPEKGTTATSGVSAPHNLPGEGKDAMPAAQLTTTGNEVTLTIGKYTLRWAAPELVNEGCESLAGDIWSLGWIAYEVMFGRVPFHDVKKDTAIMLRVIQGKLPCLTDDARMTLIQALSTVMMQCWSLDPDQRPSAEDCMVELSWMVCLFRTWCGKSGIDRSDTQPMIRPAPTAGVSQQEARIREAKLNMRLGKMYFRQSDYHASRGCYKKAVATFAEDGHLNRQAAAIEAQGNIHLLCGEFDEAEKGYFEALQIRTDIGDSARRAGALWGLAEVHRLRD